MLAEHDAVRTNRGQVDRRAIECPQLTKALEPGRIGPEQRQAWLGLPGGLVGRGDVGLQDGHHPVDIGASRQRVVHDRQGVVLDRDGGVKVGDLVLAAGDDELIDATQVLVGVGGHRVVQRVARAEGGGDDEGAEHQSDDDQGRLGLPPRDVAHAELEDDRAPPGDPGHPQETEPQDDEEDQHRAGHRDAKDVVHDDVFPSVAR